VIFFEVPATKAGSSDTVLLYGHLDKQPEFNGWRKGLGPWTPKYEDGLLYGRGGADDGYAVYAAITAIEALQAQGLPRPRCVGLIETCEESGSPTCRPTSTALKPRLGNVGLVVCLDSGAGNYDQLWLTTSLRGMVSGVLKVEILTEGIHSGDASGLVPSQLSHPAPGAGPAGRQPDRPPAAAELPLRDPRLRAGPGAGHGGHPGRRGLEALSLGLRRRRRSGPADHHRPGPGAAQPHLAAHAQRHRGRRLPGTGNAGNVLRPYTAFKLSLRLPPLVDGHEASLKLKRCWRTTRPTTPRSPSTPMAAPVRWAPPAGTRPSWRPGWKAR
jgi:acetylornithine deacetylase/succinyl-diaminopimelate desuccinylase-like protein